MSSTGTCGPRYGEFWPLLLVAIGANLILGRRLPWLTTMIVVVLLAGSVLGAALLAESDASVRVDRIDEPLLSTMSLDLGVGFGMGSLVIDSLPPGSSKLVEGRSTHHVDMPPRRFKDTMARLLSTST